MNPDKKKVVCFGEVLWDNLPSGKKPGGAPMNVAYHLQKFGIDSSVISRVGNDNNGEELLSTLASLGLSAEYCQTDPLLPTSTVEVSISEDNEVSYEIVFPVAWDNIQFEPNLMELLESSDAFVFGSLAGRNQASSETLDSLLELAKFKVFDVNLREPHYKREYLEHLLHKTDLLKLNIHELNIMSEWWGNTSVKESDSVQVLQNKFDINEVIVTRGSKGACYYTRDIHFHYPAYEIDVKDTVGSGDSFLAAFLSKRLDMDHVEEVLDFATGVGAFITMQSGACPPYNKFDINHFLWTQRLKKYPLANVLRK